MIMNGISAFQCNKILFFQSDKQGGLIYNVYHINLDVNNHITSLLVLRTYRVVFVLGIWMSWVFCVCDMITKVTVCVTVYVES